MPLFLSALLGALPAIGGLLGGLFGGGRSSAPPQITFASGSRLPPGFAGPLPQPGPAQLGYPAGYGQALPSARGGFRRRVIRGAPVTARARPVVQARTPILTPHAFQPAAERAAIGAHGQLALGHLRPVGFSGNVACPRGHSSGLAAIPISRTPEHVARARLAAMCL